MGARLAVLLVLLLFGGCGGDPPTAQEQIKATVTAIEQAVEAGSAGDAAEWLHDDYRDERHADRRAATRSLTGYLFRHRDRHLLTFIRSIDLAADGETAQVIVLVGMTGTPVETVDRLLAVKADLYRFELQMRNDDGTWQVSSSRWESLTRAGFRP
jgi:hypothetical protein